MVDLITSEIVTTPGLYRMTEAAYHADPWETPSLSRSVAFKLITDSPRHAFTAHPRLCKPEEEEEVKNDNIREIGSAAHAMLLRQPTEISVIESKDYKNKKAQIARVEAQERGAIPLLEKDHKTALAMVAKARADLSESDHPAIRALADPTSTDSTLLNEVTAAWIDPCGSLPARQRMDRLHIEPSLIAILDYKTTKMSVAPQQVVRPIFNNGYHFQDGFYRRGARALFPQIDRHECKLDFLFIMQEQDPPFEISIVRIDAAGRVIGEKMVSAAFRKWRKCMTDGYWPGYPNDIVSADMPAFVETNWLAREIEDPYLQNLGYDPMPMFEASPYRPKPIMEPN